MTRLTIGYIAHMLSLAIGGFLFGMVGMKEIRDMIATMDGSIKTKQPRAVIMAQFIDSVRFAYMKQLVETF